MQFTNITMLNSNRVHGRQPVDWVTTTMQFCLIDSDVKKPCTYSHVDEGASDFIFVLVNCKEWDRDSCIFCYLIALLLLLLNHWRRSMDGLGGLSLRVHRSTPVVQLRPIKFIKFSWMIFSKYLYIILPINDFNKIFSNITNWCNDYRGEVKKRR